MPDRARRYTQDFNDILAREETYHAFLAYLVDAQRARSVERPAYRPTELP
jgi:hypothetical protein